MTSAAPGQKPPQGPNKDLLSPPAGSGDALCLDSDLKHTDDAAVGPNKGPAGPRPEDRDGGWFNDLETVDGRLTPSNTVGQVETTSMAAAETGNLRLEPRTCTSSL